MIINPLDYSISKLNKLKPKKGRLLISEPFMKDPSFKRSVILLTEHNKDGAFGFILNQPLELTINDTINDFPLFDAPIYIGGPVQSDSLFYIHSQGNIIEGSQHIVDDLYWAGNFDQLKEMIANQQIFPNEIKFFIGYSGWDNNQLNDEIESESWIITKTNNCSITDLNHDDLWKNLLKEMSPKHATLSEFPEDPSLN